MSGASAAFAVPGEYQVVDADDVLRLTRDGWEIVQSIEDEERVQLIRDLDGPSSHDGRSITCDFRVENFHSHRSDQRCSATLRRRVRFLMRRREESVLRDVRRELQQAMDNKERSDVSVMSLQQEVESRDAELRKLRGDLQRAQTGQNDANTSLWKLQETNRKLEGDLARVQNAIGSERMDEILQRKKKS